MRPLITLSLLYVSLTAVGCASGMSYEKIEDRLPQPGPGKGRIFFYRSGSMVGAAVQPGVYVDGREVGKSQPGGFFFVDRSAGACEVACSTEVKRKVSFDVRPGDTRYVRTGISMGFFVGHVTPELVPPDVGAKEIRNKKYIGPEFPGLRQQGD